MTNTPHTGKTDMDGKYSVWGFTKQGKRRMIICAVIMLGLMPISLAQWWQWWKHNNMAVPCFLLGMGDDDGLLSEYYLDHNETSQSYYSRMTSLLRYETPGPCSPRDETKHWNFVRRIAEERDWAEANFLLALRHGYGGFFNESMLNEKSEDNLIYSVRDDLGDGNNLDLQKSFMLLQKSAMQEFELAQGVLSHVYLVGVWGKHGGLTVNVDPEQSLAWLDKAAAQKGAENSYMEPLFHAGLRRRYAEQYNLEPDYEKARKNFEVVADHQHVGAMVELAWMYAKGVGVEWNTQEAMKWIDKATNVANEREERKDYVALHKAKILAYIQEEKKQ